MEINQEFITFFRNYIFAYCISTNQKCAHKLPGMRRFDIHRLSTTMTKRKEILSVLRSYMPNERSQV